MSQTVALQRLTVLSQQVSSQEASNNVLSAVPTSAALGHNAKFPQATTMRSFPSAVHDALGLDELLTPEERAVRDRVRSFVEREVAPVVVEFWEKAEFPFALLPKLASLDIFGGTIKGYGCKGLSIMGCAMAACEIGRCDGSLSTFFLVHTFLSMITIYLLGTEQQRAELLPQMSQLTKVGCWALTEPSHGSDASALTTTARKVAGGWVIDGQKRWIGNGTWADVAIVWARNTDTKQVNAFIVRKGNPGLNTSKIENKIALRCVQNADMTFTNCFVPDSDRLPGVESFKDTNKVLAISRVMVAWQPVGVCMGVYDMCARYLKEREQFGVPLASFQLLQEKLQRMLANIQAMWLMCYRLSKLSDEGHMTHEQASMVKAWTTRQGRATVAIGRELLGGNGVVADYLVAKAFVDMEAYYTYEGTYEVNALVAGRGLTGLAAFKTGKTKL